jgi:hypothetical protein
MTPKEKASELIQKAYDLDQDNKTPIYKCKQVALLTVYEVIKTICECYPSKDKDISFVEFWEEVINELKK